MTIAPNLMTIALALFSSLTQVSWASENLEIYRPLLDAFISQEPRESENVHLNIVKSPLKSSEKEFAVIFYSSWVGKFGEFSLYQFSIGPDKKIQNIKRLKKFEAGGNHLLWKTKNKTFLQAHEEIYELTSNGPILQKSAPRNEKLHGKSTLSLQCAFSAKGACKISSY